MTKLRAVGAACVLSVTSNGHLSYGVAQTIEDAWEKLPSSAFDPNGIAEINLSSVQRDGNFVFVQIRYRTPPLTETNAQEIDAAGLEGFPASITMTQGYDCENEKFTTLRMSIITFDGQQDEMPAPPEADYEKPLEGSINEYLIETLC